MSEITEEIGRRIHVYRKRKKMTLDALAEAICKSKSTVSKYEKGEISIDIETLYDLSAALSVPIEQLLYIAPVPAEADRRSFVPAFFLGLTRFYGYIYDGRNHTLMRCVFDVLSETEDHKFRLMMYMNVKNYEDYPICENTYAGTMEHFDSVTIMNLSNQHFPIERASIQMMGSSLVGDTRPALWNGLSTRPLMPVAAKILLSRSPLEESEELIGQLKISREDIRRFRQYNMFPVV